MTKEFKQRLEEAEEEYRKEGPYILSFYEDYTVLPIPNSIKDLILFILENRQTYTVDFKNSYITVGRRRTLHDLFLLSRTYIKEEISLEDILRELAALKNEKTIETWYCRDIKRRVWMQPRYYNGYYTYRTDYGNGKDEFGLTAGDLMRELEESILINEESTLCS